LLLRHALFRNANCSSFRAVSLLNSETLATEMYDVKCTVSLEDGLDSVSRGWGSVGRRLAGATLSLPALDVDDEAEPLHASTNTSVRSSSNLQSSAQGSADFTRLDCRSTNKVALNVQICVAFFLKKFFITIPASQPQIIQLRERLRIFYVCFVFVGLSVFNVSAYVSSTGCCHC